MLDDDDPKSPVPAPEGAPAGDQAAEQQEELPLEGDESEGDEAETEPTADEGDEGDDEQDDEGEDEGDEEGVPKRKSSRVLRYKREAEAAKARLAEMRSRVTGNIPQDEAAAARAFELRVWQEVGNPPDPNDPKYANNYVRFERETQAWLNDQRTVTREVRKEFQQKYEQQQGHMAELVAEHKERIARLRTKVKDFDIIMAKATVPVSPHVEKLILESRKSDRVSLHLAKDQSKLVRLNNMSPEAAAREIGIIEGRLSLPQPKAQTKARKPVVPLRGSGTIPPSGGMSVINAYLKKQGYRD